MGLAEMYKSPYMNDYSKSVLGNPYEFDSNLSFGDQAVSKTMLGTPYTVGNIGIYAGTSDLVKPVEVSDFVSSTTTPQIEALNGAYNAGELGAEDSTGWSIPGFENGNVLGMDQAQIGGLASLGGLAMKGFALPSMMDYYNTQTDTAKFNLAAAKKALANQEKFNATTNEAFSLAGESFKNANQDKNT